MYHQCHDQIIKSCKLQDQRIASPKVLGLWVPHASFYINLKVMGYAYYGVNIVLGYDCEHITVPKHI